MKYAKSLGTFQTILQNFEINFKNFKIFCFNKNFNRKLAQLTNNTKFMQNKSNFAKNASDDNHSHFLEKPPSTPTSQHPLDLSLTTPLTTPTYPHNLILPTSTPSAFPSSLLALNSMAAAFQLYKNQNSLLLGQGPQMGLLGHQGRRSLVGTPGRRAREKTMLPCQICGKAFDRPSLLKVN